MKAPANKLVIKLPKEVVILFPAIVNNKVKNSEINYNKHCIKFSRKNIINIF